MKLSKILVAAASAALALMAFASTASATTLETNGVKQSGAVTIDWSLSGSLTWESTSGSVANQCSASTVKTATSVFTGTTVSGPVSSLSFSSCTHEKVKVNSAGSLSVERIGATTNGTVRSSGASVTVPVTVFGSVVEVTCTTNNTDLGTLTGTASGTNSTSVTVNAVLSCSGLMPTMKWTAKFVITGHAIGVVS
jgi:hypothetical protein